MEGVEGRARLLHPEVPKIPKKYIGGSGKVPKVSKSITKRKKTAHTHKSQNPKVPKLPRGGGWLFFLLSFFVQEMVKLQYQQISWLYFFG